jgi:hypothetical protein
MTLEEALMTADSRTGNPMCAGEEAAIVLAAEVRRLSGERKSLERRLDNQRHTIRDLQATLDAVT